MPLPWPFAIARLREAPWVTAVGPATACDQAYAAAANKIATRIAAFRAEPRTVMAWAGVAASPARR